MWPRKRKISIMQCKDTRFIFLQPLKIKYMKRLIFLLLVFLPLFVTGQRLEGNLPRIEDVPVEQRKAFRANLKAYEKQAKANEAAGFDFWLDAGEQVPTFITNSTATLSDQTNWGEQLLISKEVRERIAKECTKPVLVKVGDTGGKQMHNDLQEGQIPGSSYTGEADLLDGNGHGTHCAGIIVGNKFGAVYELIKTGVVKYKPLKFLNNGGAGSFTWAANGILNERAQDLAFINAGGGVVYSNSWGGGTTIVPVLDAELKTSSEKGIFFVFATGNTGGPVNYPGLSEYVISCASLDQSMVVSSYSSRGPQVWNAMPGRNINSTYKDNGFAVLSGTSMATPFLTSAVVVALSKWGKAAFPTLQSMKDYLRKCATDIPPAGLDDPSGWGTLFFLNILNTSPGGTPPPPPPPPVDPPVAEKITVSTTFGNVAMRYAFAGETMLRNLNIIELTLSAEGATAEEAHAAINQTADKFFANSYIAEIPLTGKASETGLYGATYWTGTFLNYAGRPNKLRVARIVAKAEGVLALPVVLDGVFNRFTDDVTPDSYETTSAQPSLRSIKQ